MEKTCLMQKETLYKIFEVAEKEHLNLFHSIDKQEFYKELDKTALIIEKLDLNQINYEMSRLFALFKDGHTAWAVPTNHGWLPMSIIISGEKFYITTIDSSLSDLKYKEITAINGKSIQKIYNKMKQIIPAETEIWSGYRALSCIINVNYLNMLGLDIVDDFVNITVEGKDYILPKTLKNYDCLGNNYPWIKYYYSIKTVQNAKVLEYFKCWDDANYSFENFFNDVAKTLDKNDRIIVDLRNNTGGNSAYFTKIVNEILVPNNIKGCALINEGCFSSGRIAVQELKNLGFTLIGKPTGGVSKSYGENKFISIDNWNFTVCKKYFDFTNEIIPDGELKPDIYVENDIEDYRNGVDKVMQKAINMLQNNKELER